MPPCYQLIIVLSKPTSKLSYRNLQYFTYVKDTNLNVHIKVFKKAIRVNGQTMEVDTRRKISIFNWFLWR
jgi:hypothetical protein